MCPQLVDGDSTLVLTGSLSRAGPTVPLLKAQAQARRSLSARSLDISDDSASPDYWHVVPQCEQVPVFRVIISIRCFSGRKSPNGAWAAAWQAHFLSIFLIKLN